MGTGNKSRCITEEEPMKPGKRKAAKVKEEKDAKQRKTIAVAWRAVFNALKDLEEDNRARSSPKPRRGKPRKRGRS